MKIKDINIKTEVKDSYNKIVTKFGTGAKIDASKKLIGKEVLILIPKKKRITKLRSLNIKKEIESLYTKTVTKFGNGAKIDCFKEYIGKNVTIFIL